MYTYRWISLVKHMVNCSKISFEEFMNMMIADINAALVEYNRLYLPWLEDARKREYEYRLNSMIKYAEEFAMRKWKTESRRQKYVDDKVQEFKDNFKTGNTYRELSYFDFDCDPSDMCTTTTISTSFINDPRYMRRVYDALVNSEYFKKGLGWELCYETRDNSYDIAFRPQIKLIVSDQVGKEMETDRQNLNKSVNEFYANTVYFGD